MKLSVAWLYLTGLFLVILKVFDIINWSWWIVLAPIWIPWLLVALAFMFMGIVFALVLIHVTIKH